MKLISKTNILLICGIVAAVASAFFLVLKITPLFIVAYTFAIIGIAALAFGMTYLMSSGKSYPWFAAFPMAIWSYLTTQVLFSVVFIVAENMFGWSFSAKWFALIHIIMLAVTAIILITLNAGKGYIEARGADVKEKVTSLKMLVADLEAATENMPSMKDEIKGAVDALRYSDPMSNPALEKYDNAIGDSVALIEQAVAKGDAQNIPTLCATLQRQIKDRNNRLKLMK
jgi:hypothetical protein